jgi:hypothetical protein
MNFVNSVLQTDNIAEQSFSTDLIIICGGHSYVNFRSNITRTFTRLYGISSVSSSGHLSLFQHFFGLDNDSSVAVAIVLHLGSLVAVFIAFWDKIWVLILEFFSMLKDIFTGKFKWKTMNGNRRMIIMIIISILPLFAFYIFKDFFEGIASDSDITVEGIAFLYTSALLFISTKCKPGNKATGTMLTKDAVFVGIYQGVALIREFHVQDQQYQLGFLQDLNVKMPLNTALFWEFQ